VKAEKCFFGRAQLPFLGHIISRDGIKVDPTKVDAMKYLPAPHNVSEVRSLLGMFSYYRRFIDNFASIAEPLHKLLKKNNKFEWNETTEEAFQTLKDKLTSAPILIRPNYNKEFIIVTDASNVGLGAVLEQIDEDKERRPVSYWSRSLQPRERNYTVTERECLAVVEAIKHFRHYVYGTHFTVYTDHNALKWLQSAKDLTGRLQRWSLRLQEHDFTIEYRKGKDNCNADGLSRLGHDKKESESFKFVVAAMKTRSKSVGPEESKEMFQSSEEAVDDEELNEEDENVQQEEEEVDTTHTYEAGDSWKINDLEFMDLKSTYTAEALHFKQQEDSFVGAIWRAVLAKQYPGKYRGPNEEDKKYLTGINLNDFEEKHGILYHLYKTKVGEIIKQIVIPEELRDEYKLHVHESIGGGGHLGFNKAFEKLINRYWWPNMAKELEEWIKSCPKCLARKGVRAKAPIQPNIVVGEPFA
jgi:hypothetical protein